MRNGAWVAFQAAQSLHGADRPSPPGVDVTARTGNSHKGVAKNRQVVFFRRGPLTSLRDLSKPAAVVPDGSRRTSEHASEGSIHVALVTEPSLEGNGSAGLTGLAQEARRAFHSVSAVGSCSPSPIACR